MYSSSFSLETRQGYNFIWQFFPPWTTLLSGLFPRLVKDTTQDDKVNNPTADLPNSRTIYALVGSSNRYISLRLQCLDSSTLGNFPFGVNDPSALIESLTEGMGRFLKYDYLFAFASGGFWVLLIF